MSAINRGIFNGGWWTVFVKEVRENIRDRRAMGMALLYGPLFGPVLFALMTSFIGGKTLDEARRGLIYKLSSRDTTPFKAWKHGTTITLSDAINAYRSITGACESGTRHFCELAVNLPDKLTVSEAIKLTTGQYGSDVFAKFFSA